MAAEYEECPKCCYNDGYDHEDKDSPHDGRSYMRRGIKTDFYTGVSSYIGKDFTCLCNKHKAICDSISREYHEPHHRVQQHIDDGGKQLEEMYNTTIAIIDSVNVKPENDLQLSSFIQTNLTIIKSALDDLILDYTIRRRWRNKCTSTRGGCEFKHDGHQVQMDLIKKVIERLTPMLKTLIEQSDPIFERVKQQRLDDIKKQREEYKASVEKNAYTETIKKIVQKKLKKINEYTAQQKRTITSELKKMIKEHSDTLGIPVDTQDEINNLKNYNMKEILLEEFQNILESHLQIKQRVKILLSNFPIKAYAFQTQTRRRISKKRSTKRPAKRSTKKSTKRSTKQSTKRSTKRSTKK
jgi:hypothetical protein